MAPDLTRLDSGRGHSGLGGGYLANVPRLPQMHVKRDSEAPLARALRKKTTARLLSSSPCALPCVSVCSASRHVRQQAYHSRSSPFCVTCPFPPRDIDTCLRGSSFIPHIWWSSRGLECLRRDIWEQRLGCSCSVFFCGLGIICTRSRESHSWLSNPSLVVLRSLDTQVTGLWLSRDQHGYPPWHDGARRGRPRVP